MRNLAICSDLCRRGKWGHSAVDSCLKMLYPKNRASKDIHKGGQSPIVHLVADLENTIAWANQKNKKWAFTSSNAGSFYFEDFHDLSQLNEINWDAVHEHYWSGCREEKQAEFLIEDCFPWNLVEEIGVISTEYYKIVERLATATHKPKINVRNEWYY